MSDERFVNGLITERGLFQGKLQCSVNYADGCSGLASASFQPGDIVRSEIVPLTDGRHTHEIHSKVPDKRPRTLANQEKDHSERGVKGVDMAPIDEEFELPVDDQTRRAIHAARYEQDGAPINTGKPTNPFADGFIQQPEPMPMPTVGKRHKPRSAFDDPRG